MAGGVRGGKTVARQLRGHRPCIVTLEADAGALRLCSSGLEDRVELLEAVGPAAAVQLEPLLRGELTLGQ